MIKDLEPERIASRSRRTAPVVVRVELLEPQSKSVAQAVV